jgi:hypothetical protein
MQLVMKMMKRTTKMKKTKMTKAARQVYAFLASVFGHSSRR